jgi:hypothetical protein
MSASQDQSLDSMFASIAKFKAKRKFGSLEQTVYAYEKSCAAWQKIIEAAKPTSNTAIDAIALATRYMDEVKLSASYYKAIGDFIEWLQAQQRT